MARTPNSSAEITRARIIESALELFAAKTYAATSLQDIAASIEMSKAALYYHFPSKDALLHAIFTPTIERIERVLANAARPDGTVDRVQLVGELVDVEIEHAVAVRALVGDPSVGAALRDRLHLDRLRSEITTALTDPSDHASKVSRMRARCALGAINWSIITTTLERRTTNAHRRHSAPRMFTAQERDTITAAALDVLGLS